MSKKTRRQQDRPLAHIMAALQNAPWLISDDGMELLMSIATRDTELTPESISAIQAAARSAGPMTVMYDDTAVISVKGPVFRYANMFTEMSGATSAESVSTELSRLAQDDSVKRVVGLFDTPGGQSSGAAEMSDQWYDFPKPLVSFGTGQSASLGYFWMSQASRVVVAEDAIVGNIGVKAPEPVQGDKMVLSRNAPRKILGRESIQTAVDELEAVFINHVARGRGVDPEDVSKNFGRGDVFVGQKAVEAGLADSTGTLDSILGGDFPSTSPVRRSRTSHNSSSEKDMSDKKDDETGGVTAAAHKDAIKAEQNKTAAAVSEAVDAENARCVAIFEASAGKPLDSVLMLMKNRKMDKDEAVSFVGTLPEVKTTSKLESDMSGGGGNDDVVDDPEDKGDGSAKSAEAKDQQEVSSALDAVFGDKA